ncbi:hypothetical protein ACWDZ8_09490 [Streptomyces sp. NPDC003233]
MRADRARGVHAWDRSIRVWDTYFALAWAATLAMLLGADHPVWPVRAVAAGLLVPLVPWYLLVGRPLLGQNPPDERRAVYYLVGAWALFLPSGVLVVWTRSCG